MNETQDLFPLIYFQRLLENDVSEKLINNFISDFVQNSGYNPHEIDNLEGIIKYYGPQVDEDGNHTSIVEITLDFNSYFQNEINIETQKAKNIINSIINNLALENKSNIEYIQLLITLLDKLILKKNITYSRFPIIKIKLEELYSFIDNYMPNNNLYLDLFSFNWKEDEIYLAYEKIRMLYNLLSTYKIINASESEFIKAFTYKEVKTGINWIDLAKNGQTNKQSIFYLIEKLIDGGHIYQFPNHEYNKKINYVFRDNEGKPLINIRQSKNTFFENTSYSHAIIDQVLSQL
jgi:hypothetical protein